MVLFLELRGDCWVEGWPALVLLLKRQRKEWRRQICCLPSCAWGCLWTFENHPLGFMQSAQMFWFRHSGPSPLTFSHKFSSWVFPGPASLLSPHSPLSPHLFLLLLSQVISICKTSLLLSPLLSFLMRDFSGLEWFGHWILPFASAFLGGKERAREPHLPKGAVFSPGEFAY